MTYITRGLKGKCIEVKVLFGLSTLLPDAELKCVNALV